MTYTEAEKTSFHKCPNCGMKRLKEVIDSDDCVHHNCQSCSYIMIWKPRRTFTTPVPKEPPRVHIP